MIAAIRCAVAIGLCAATFQVQAQIAKCVDPKTGAITYSNTGCAASDQATTIRRDAPVSPRPDELERITGTAQATQSRFAPDARVDGLAGRAESSRQLDKANSIECEQAKRKLAVRKSHVTKFASDAKRADIDVDGACGYPRRQATAPHTAQALAPASAGVPPQLVNCDPAGCWDTQGRRYLREGTTLLRPGGMGVCTQLDGGWNCP